MSNPLFDKIIIEGLFGKTHLNYALPFDHEKKWLILNAANGQGKTTLLRALFHYLSGQWEQITKSNLSKVFMTQNGNIRAMYRPSGKAPSGRIDQSIRDHYYEKYDDIRPELEDLFTYTIGELQRNTNLVQELIDRHGTHQSKFYAVYKEILRSALNIQQTALEDIRILFLPTYRRIERTTEEVFPNFVDALTGRLMNNVEALKQKKVDDAPLPNFNLEERPDYNHDVLKEIEDELNYHYQKKHGLELTAYLAQNRTQVAAEIKQYWEDYHNTSMGANPNQKIDYQVLVGFGMKDIEQKVQEFSLHMRKEPWMKQRIYQWLEICNKCFFEKHKKLYYYPNEHKVSVECYLDESTMHPLDILSSGEKQVAALFAHVLFSKSRVFLILDEPELSLSEPWQKIMMDELSNLQNLAGMVVASHSSVILKYAKAKYTQTLNALRVNKAY